MGARKSGACAPPRFIYAWSRMSQLLNQVLRSVESALSLLNVSLLLLWYVDEINGTVVRHDCQSVVFKVESDRLHFLIHFDLCKTQVTLPILIKYLHELETTKEIKVVSIAIEIHLITYPDFVFLASTFFYKSPLEKPNYLVWMHFSTAFVISKMWMDCLEDVHARMYWCGWNRMLSISALLLPLFSSCTTSPASVL